MLKKTIENTSTASVMMARFRKTLRYINISLMSSIGPSTIKASCADSGTLVERNDAATKASASLHRFNTMAITIIISIDNTVVACKALPK